MPNHVTTVLRADPEVLAGFCRDTTEEERAEARGVPERIVDFELVVPSPPNKETGGCNGKHENGEVCWYSWNTENWGTKWGAYSCVFQEDRPDLVIFETAWAHPFPVVTALSRKYPSRHIEVSYADEDTGSNLGQYVMLNGEVVQQTEIIEQSEAAYEFACQINYGKSWAEVKAEWGEDE